MPSTIWIAAAVIVVIVVRRFSRLVGSALGLLTSFALVGWGHWVYSVNGKMAILNFELPASGFYVFVALWAGLECFELVRAINRRRELKRNPAPAATDDESDAESEDEQ